MHATKNENPQCRLVTLGVPLSDELKQFRLTFLTGTEHLLPAKQFSWLLEQLVPLGFAFLILSPQPLASLIHHWSRLWTRNRSRLSHHDRRGDDLLWSVDLGDVNVSMRVVVNIANMDIDRLRLHCD